MQYVNLLHCHSILTTVDVYRFLIRMHWLVHRKIMNDLVGYIMEVSIEELE